MSKITKFLWSLLPLLSLLFVVSCGEDPVDNGGEITSTIKLKSGVVEAKAKGGAYSVNYTIENPADGETINVACEADWISNIDRTTAGIIKFDVAENPVEAVREATVTVSYKGAEDATFTVKQESAMPLNLTFEVDEVSMGYRTCTFDIYPADQNTAYLVGIYTMDYIREYGLEDDDALFEDDLAYFEWLGQYHGLTALDIMDVRKKYGNTYEIAATVRPDTENLLYMYYVDLNTGERLSDIHRHVFTAPAVDLQDIAFEFDCAINGPAVTINAAAPSSYLDAFYFDIMPKEGVDKQVAANGFTIEEYFEKWWNNIACDEMDQQKVAGDIVAQACSYTNDTYSVELLADTEYYVFAFAVNEEAFCASVPVYETIRTGAVAPSDNEISIIVTDITPCGATLRFRPTNNDPYVAGWATKAEWNSYGATERERIANIIKNYDFGSDYLYGEMLYTEKAGLESETEYVVFAMGFRGGVATTGLFTTEFKTLSSEPSPETLKFKRLGYFNISEINEVDPTFGNMNYASYYAIYPIEIEVSDPSVKAYYSNYLVTAGNKEWYTYDYVLSSMLEDGAKPMFTYTFVEYGIHNLVVAVGRDSEGRYTEMDYDYFFAEQAECNHNVQEFLDWRESWWGTTAVPASVVIDETKIEKQSEPLFTRKAVVVEAPAKQKFAGKAAMGEAVHAADALIAR